MKISDLLIPEFDTEIATTRRVLERVPDDGDKGAWKPHVKAFPMAHLAQLVARLPGWVSMMIEKDELDVAPTTGPRFPGYTIEKTATLLAEFDRNSAAARQAIAHTGDDAFQAPWTLKASGQVINTLPRYQMLRSLALNHLVHHRAQLGLYLRLAGEKVPEMYGPTADSPQPS